MLQGSRGNTREGERKPPPYGDLVGLESSSSEEVVAMAASINQTGHRYRWWAVEKKEGLCVSLVRVWVIFLLWFFFRCVCG